MRRKDKAILDPHTINKILTESHICRLGLNDVEYPYILPMNYGYQDHCLYFHCAVAGKKIDLIEKNNKASFEIEYDSETIKDKVSCNWTTKYRSIMGFGEVEIIRDFNTKEAGLEIIMKQHGKTDNSFNEKMIDRVLILKLSITELTAKQSGDW
jgi:nitroimidazol reductase NimA-like FMN-containing flavoprotein (pyridoxamine 5'-phosphate oxidase superfamily)